MERIQYLDHAELTQLAQYNAEVSRGILHTPAYELKMKALQVRFDATPPDHNYRPVQYGSRWSRFFRSAAFPILVVVVLAFITQKVLF